MNLLELFGPISTFIFEVDGVLAADMCLIREDGQKTYHISSKDAYAMHLAVTKGYTVWLVTNGGTGWLKEWQNAGIGIIDRSNDGESSSLDELLQKDTGNRILYMGADLPAYQAMRTCGLPVCPADAAPEIKGLAKYVSPLKGGQGCIRDVVEKVMKLNCQWQLPG